MRPAYAEEKVSRVAQVLSVSISGDSRDWMEKVGISPNDYSYVDYIINHEGGWNGVTKYNYAGSGAYGICQSLPASKMASAGSDFMVNPVTQLRWCNSYAISRYGSWANAYYSWLKQGWW